MPGYPEDYCLAVSDVQLAIEASQDDDPDYYRREAMGAFAHEVRTPLTSVKMVMELARRQSSEGQLLLDPELAEMLKTSIDDLQRLADDLQEASRIERGKVSLSRGPCDLAVAVAAARDLAGPALTLAGNVPPGIEGPWDAARLVRAIAAFTESANRMGDGEGIVQLNFWREADGIHLTFQSGEPGTEERKVAADSGFGFFRSRQFVLAMDGSVDCARSDRYASIAVSLPLKQGSSA